jgi:hypothetical protein
MRACNVHVCVLNDGTWQFRRNRLPIPGSICNRKIYSSHYERLCMCIVYVNMSAIANPETMRVKKPNILIYKLGFIVIFLEKGSRTSDVGFSISSMVKILQLLFGDICEKRERKTNWHHIPITCSFFFNLYKIFKIVY